MKRIFFRIAVTLFVLSAVLVSCEEKQVVPPAPPYLQVAGTVTDETNQPLSSIQVTIEFPEIFKPYVVRDVYICYTDDIGQYGTDCLSCEAILRSEVSWLDEITVSAKDTLGVYEEQTITVPVETYARYSDEKWENIIDAKAQADFVMHKKVE